MRVAFLRSWNHWPAGDAPHGTNTHYRAGRRYELPDDVARAAIAAGRAVLVEPERLRKRVAAAFAVASDTPGEAAGGG